MSHIRVIQIEAVSKVTFYRRGAEAQRKYKLIINSLRLCVFAVNKKYTLLIQPLPQQQLPPVSQSQLGSVPRNRPFMIPAAQPTPDFTVMASSGQFFAHAPHSMQKSLWRMTAFLLSISKTACGHTIIHIRQPLHFLVSSSSVTTPGK
jgi:hypothetical protein